MSSQFDLNPGKHQASKRGFVHQHNSSARPTTGKKAKVSPRKKRNVKFFKESASIVPVLNPELESLYQALSDAAVMDALDADGWYIE